ncbi:hypothetical protein O3P69_013448 [Scylla paramamosain]|uniref:Uncharacterized protein n=1 Tax=Scylla paramamosain TaxID=85552 RepID=A0AAW0S982_SCYPA
MKSETVPEITSSEVQFTPLLCAVSQCVPSPSTRIARVLDRQGTHEAVPPVQQPSNARTGEAGLGTPQGQDTTTNTTPPFTRHPGRQVGGPARWPHNNEKSSPRKEGGPRKPETTDSFQDYQESVNDAWDCGDDEFCVISGNGVAVVSCAGAKECW